MLKIGLITIHSILNYGSVLQAFATQKFLKNTGYECTIINYQFPTLWHRYKYVKSMGFCRGIRFILHLIKLRFSKSFWIGNKKFKKFRKDNLVLTKKYYFTRQLKEEGSKYDIYIAGSDQIWNPYTTFGDKAFFLGFVRNWLPKIAYSSSISSDYIPQKLQNKYLKFLSGFKYIGVREESALQLIKGLNGKIVQPQLVCDPTFLLDAKEYYPLIIQSKLEIDSDYILIYALNYSFDPNPALEFAIKKAYNYYKCKIIVITNPITSDIPHIFVNNVGPEDFVKLFSKAKYIITSSFHGLAFSIIFRRKFLAISPKSGDTRIIDIINELSLYDNLRYNDEIEFCMNYNNPYSIYVESKIMSLRKSSILFLKNSINSINYGKDY